VLQPLLGLGLHQKMLHPLSFALLITLASPPQHHAALSTVHLGLGGPLPVLAIYRCFPLCDNDAKGWLLEGSQVGKLDLLSVKSKL